MLQTSKIPICSLLHVTKLSSAESKQLQSSSLVKMSSFIPMKFPIILTQPAVRTMQSRPTWFLSLEEGAG